MELSDVSRRLMHEWEAGRGMERLNNGCCCCCEGRGRGGERGGGEGGEAESLQQQDALIQHLCKKKARLQRMNRCLAATVLLLGAAVVALAVVVALVGLGHPPPERKPNSHPGVSAKQHQHQHQESGIPLAMLTAPMHTNSSQKLLAWESQRWNAFCHGGFQYSNGYLTVPREGTYRVFLQITHQSKDDLCDDSDGELKTFAYKVLMFNNDYGEVTLLSSRDSMACSDEPWTRTLYASGLFLLKRHSTLHVTSSHPEIILRQEYFTFFGAELLF